MGGGGGCGSGVGCGERREENYIFFFVLLTTKNVACLEREHVWWTTLNFTVCEKRGGEGRGVRGGTMV